MFIACIQKSIPLEGFRGEKMKFVENVQKMVEYSLNDPIVKILLKNSNLTKTQLETLLIDILADNYSEKPLNYDKKARLRLTKPPVTRGAFNRTLKQARRNVIEAIYTVMLLGYLGLFENTTLTPYLEIANKLQTYLTSFREMTEKRELSTQNVEIIRVLRQEIENSLRELSNV